MPRSAQFPVLTDRQAALARLAREEKAVARELATFEERLRRFAHDEQPRYDAWVRLQFGPKFSVLEELLERVHAARVRIWRAEAPVESEGEAEVQARRRAKREAKRAQRKQDKRSARPSEQPAPGKPGGSDSRAGIVSLYRTLARRLHPDSPLALRSPRVAELWLEVQDAYERSDQPRLLAIAAWVAREGDEATEAFAPSVSLSERAARLRAMRSVCQRLRKSVDVAAEHPAWGFGTAEAPRLKQLRKRVARGLEEELARAQETLEACEELLAELD